MMMSAILVLASAMIGDEWLDSYDEGLRAAKLSGRPILIYILDSD